MRKIRTCGSLLLLSLALAGCSTRPDNRLVPAVSFAARAQRWYSGSKDVDALWLGQFYDQMKTMDGWAPPALWFTSESCLSNEMKQVEERGRYPVSLLPAATHADLVQSNLHDAGGYFFRSEAEDELGMTNFLSRDFLAAAGISQTNWLPANPDEPLMGKINELRLAANMLLRIDQEHETLLTSNTNGLSYGAVKYKERGEHLFSSSPRMASRRYPAGVSVAVVQAAGTEKASNSTNSQPLVTINNYLTGSPAGEASPKTNSSNSSIDFNPTADITLSLSTVLNSADVLDRIEYVSTFIYIYPYPNAPNANVSLDDEFWKRFYSYQLPRGDGWSNALACDLNSSFNSMRVRFKNVTTTALTRDLNLGTITRGTENDLSATIAAAFPIAPASVNPSVSAASKATSSATSAMLKQLDQRSSYISQDGAFLRITQRGMSSVNLNGRFNEQVQLYVPAAVDPIYAIALKEFAPGSKPNSSKDPALTTNMPGSTAHGTNAGNLNLNIDSSTNEAARSGFELVSLAKPIYSRVDAVVVSLVVIRHPTKLRRSNRETFGLPLDDAADTDFIVGLPRPSKLTLWNWERHLTGVFSSDLNVDATGTNNVRIYFDSPSSGLYVAQPLYLANFDDVQAAQFEGKIQNAIQHQFAQENSADPNDPLRYLTVTKEADSAGNNQYFIRVNDRNTGTTIRLGRHDQNTPRLLGFPPGTPFLTSYAKGQ